jgi:hypothetical protein
VPNDSRHTRNQPPARAGKTQSRHTGSGRLLEKRSEVLQARRGRPDLNLEDSGEEYAWRSPEEHVPRRKKAGH